jgi:hypothetical protein
MSRAIRDGGLGTFAPDRTRFLYSIGQAYGRPVQDDEPASERILGPPVACRIATEAISASSGGLAGSACR